MLIGELEKRSGVRRSMIHYYLQYGLLHQPHKTGQTMAYYDESHLRRLELIQKIKRDFITATNSTRVPLDFILHKITDGYTLTKDKKSTSTKNSKKRNSENALRKKEEIIEATLKLYTKRGYYLTSIREITNEVGITAPTFYYYFQDKRELFIEAIEYVIRNYHREMKEAIAAESDDARKSIILFRIFYDNYPKIGEILHQLRASVAIGDPWAKERLSKLYSEMTEDISKGLRGMIEAGLIRDIDPKLLALFNILLDEIVMHLASVDDRYELNQLLVFMADMIYHAFLTDKGKEIFQIYDSSRWKRGKQ